MSKRITVNPSINNGKLKCEIFLNDSKLFAKNFIVEIFQILITKKGEICQDKIIYSKKFVLNKNNEIIVNIDNSHYSYIGRDINIKYSIYVTTDNGFFNSLIFGITSTTESINLRLVQEKNSLISYENTKNLIELKDRFDYKSSFMAISWKRKTILLFLYILFGILISIIWLYFSEGTNIKIENKMYFLLFTFLIIFFSFYLLRLLQYICKVIIGKNEMKITILLTYILIVILGIIITMDKNTFPLAKPIGFTLFSSIFIMYLTQRIDLLKLMLNKLIFKGYMTLGLRKNLIIRKNVQYKTSDLIAGVSKIPLENVELRIIAYNIERGEYATGSGKTMEIHTINTPVNGIMIYSEKVQYISENVNISNYFKGNIIFDRLYENLYPELIVGKSNSIMGKDNGIILQCEIQLICDKLIDQKLILSSVYFEQDDFTF